MGRVTAVPREVLDAAWRAGLEGRRIWIPPRADEKGKRSDIVRDLLLRAERRVMDTADVRSEAIRAAWGTERKEAEHYGVSPSLVWRACQEAERELVRWWRAGERERQQKLRGMAGAAESLAEYQRARREIRAGRSPRNVKHEILTMAASSVADSWWGQESEESGGVFRVAEEAAYLAVLRLDGRVNMVAVSRIVGSRVGLTEAAIERLAGRIEKGVARGVEALQPFRRTA